MLTFEPTFRTLLLKKIRGLTEDQLFAYEGLVALRLELVQTLERTPNQTDEDKRQRTLLEQQIKRAGNLAYDIIKDFEKKFIALHELWVARQGFALQQGNYFQSPFNWRKFVCYCSSWWDYRKSQVKTVAPFRGKKQGRDK